MQNDIQDKINTLDRISGWVTNCDTKSSIMMALVGVFISIIFTSDFLLNSLQDFFVPISLYWKTGSGTFSLFITIIILFFIGTIICLLLALFHLIKSLSAKTCSMQTGDVNLRTNSLIHYGSIQKTSYDIFKSTVLAETEDNRLDDILSQIYINSKRCQEKFDDYNKSKKLIKCGIILFVIFVLLLII
jgi:hypothetical protein